MILETIDAIPRHLVMPQQTEMIFTTICGVGLILSLVYMALQIRKRGDLVPLYAYVGAALAFLYERWPSSLRIEQMTGSKRLCGNNAHRNVTHQWYPG